MSAATASWTNAAESLLVDLTKGSIGTSLPLDATQQELSMSRPLVYMAGLTVVVDGSDGPSYPPLFTKEQKSLFQRIQTLYHGGRQETLYELSPTLLPCEAARKEIQQAVEKRVKEIEEKSAKVAKELLEAEQKAKKTKKKKATTKKKERNQSQSIISSPEKEDASESQSLSALFIRQLQSTSSDEDADESGSWMEVTKKSKEPVVLIPSVEESKSLDDDDEEENIQPSYYVTPSLPTLELSANAKLKVEKKPLPLHVEEKVEAKQEPPENNTDTNTSPSTLLVLPVVNTPTVYTTVVDDPTDSFQQLQGIIRQLESQLWQKNQDLQEERAAHNTALQSLQLRLYISETRLKTFEDALEQHVQSVANNTAPTSPERRRIRPEEQATTTPLLSRVQVLNREG
jgi:hypothetical protein